MSGSASLTVEKINVEGKGFVYLSALNIRDFVAVILQNAAN